MNEFLTVAQVAKHLKKYPGTIRRWIAGKKLPAARIAGKNGIFIVSRSDMLEFMMSRMMEEKKSSK